LKEALKEPQPHVAALIHHGVPGVGNFLWDHELLPIKQELAAKGCEFRMMTVLRQGYSRLESDVNYFAQTDILKTTDIFKYSLDGDCHQTDWQCSFAASNANTEVKYLLAGDHTQWPMAYRWSTAGEQFCPGAAPEALGDNKGTGNATYDRKVLLPRAASVIRKMYMVGQTENLEAYLAKMNACLGIEDIITKNVNPTEYDVGLTVESSRCVADATTVDEELYYAFCSNHAGGFPAGLA